MDEREAIFTMFKERLDSIDAKLDKLTIDVARMQGAQEARGRTQMVIAGLVGAAFGAIPSIVTYFKAPH